MPDIIDEFLTLALLSINTIIDRYDPFAERDDGGDGYVGVEFGDQNWPIQERAAVRYRQGHRGGRARLGRARVAVRSGCV
jgi:hypothetical protein